MVQIFQPELQSSFLDEKRPRVPFNFKRSEALHDVILSSGIVRLVTDLLILPIPSRIAYAKRVQVASLKVLELDLEDTTRVVLRYRDMLAEAAVSIESGRLDDTKLGRSVVSQDGIRRSAWRHLKNCFFSASTADTLAPATSPHFAPDTSVTSGPASLALGITLLRARMKSPLELKRAERKLRDSDADHSSGIRGRVATATIEAHGYLAEAVLNLLWTSVRMGPSGVKVCLRVNLLRSQLPCR